MAVFVSSAFSSFDNAKVRHLFLAPRRNAKFCKVLQSSAKFCKVLQSSMMYVTDNEWEKPFLYFRSAIGFATSHDRLRHAPQWSSPRSAKPIIPRTLNSLLTRGWASVNLQFSSFSPRRRLSELISALGLASVATKGDLSPQRSANVSEAF